MYEKYPDFNIDVDYEKKLLEKNQIIIWQHPFYWYSAPPLLKQWIDLVLEFGWAYGPGESDHSWDSETIRETLQKMA